jgi:hypothetical protein
MVVADGEREEHIDMQGILWTCVDWYMGFEFVFAFAFRIQIEVLVA